MHRGFAPPYPHYGAGAPPYFLHGQPQHPQKMLPPHMLGAHGAPLSRRSQSNSHAMTVKEHEQKKDSLSLCSISDQMSNSRQDERDRSRQGGDSPVKGVNVVLTPICNENHKTGRNSTLKSLF